MAETIFSKIIAREIPADIVFEDDDVLAFRDISPQAPTHVVVIPKKPLLNLLDASDADALLLGKLLLTAASVARSLGVAEDGFRVVVNVGPDAGESVPHLHLHVLAGRHLTWPPG